MPRETKISPSGGVSPEQIQAEGDYRIKVIILVIVGVILVLLVVGGLVLNGMKGEVTAYWNTILPIISGSIFGLIGFVVGSKVGGD
jgi:uncharacterized protein YacL